MSGRIIGAVEKKKLAEEEIGPNAVRCTKRNGEVD